MSIQLTYAIEYTPNENEGSQWQEVSKEVFDEILSKYGNAKLELDEHGTLTLFDVNNYFYQ